MAGRSVGRLLVRVLGIGVLLVLAMLLGPERGQAAQIVSQTGEASEAYTRLCAACHGPAGEGTALGPGLTGSQMEGDDLVEIITNGSSLMPAFGPTLTPGQVDELVSFVGGLASNGATATGGAAIYAESCAGCHGVDGEGGLGPNLRTAVLSRDDLTDAVTQGKGTMPGFADQMTPEDIAELVAFLENLGAESPDTSEPSLVALGADLFADNCARCHGPDAAGGFGPALKYSALTDVELVSVISNGRGNMPSFSEILTSADTTALVAYVESTAASDAGADSLTAVAHGREVYVASCAACHGLDAGGGLGPSLAGTTLSANEIVSEVFGIHAGRMPDFEGVLDATQVQDVARYVLTIEGSPASRTGLLVVAVVAVLALVGAAVLWFGGFFGSFFRRSR
jgi:mono/diheme cytochrome c family protein